VDNKEQQFWVRFNGFKKDVYEKHRVFREGGIYKAKRHIERCSEGYRLQTLALSLDGKWLRIYDGEYTEITRPRPLKDADDYWVDRIFNADNDDQKTDAIGDLIARVTELEERLESAMRVAKFHCDCPAYGKMLHGNRKDTK